MNCWTCERPAHGICRFCGRAVCKEHAKHMPYILDIFGPGHNGDGYRGLVVPDVVYCGVCKPQDEPVKLDPLK
jgi:hypothetical protein